jgi:hypothetical protein
MGDRVEVTLMRDGKEINATKDKPAFTFDSQPLKFCPDCGGNTLPIIYVCKDCGKRYIKQLESTSGKTLIIAIQKEAEEQNTPIPPT